MTQPINLYLLTPTPNSRRAGVGFADGIEVAIDVGGYANGYYSWGLYSGCYIALLGKFCSDQIEYLF